MTSSAWASRLDGTVSPSALAVVKLTTNTAFVVYLTIRSYCPGFGYESPSNWPMTVSNDNAIAILRIELEDIEPLIWRRVAMPASMDLKAVHGGIQAALGWLDCHLWEFEANTRKYGLLIPNDSDWNGRITNAATTKLSSLVADGVTDIRYVYDMGDNWQHRIIVEKLVPAESGVRYPVFLGGERRCPPEDCGGFPGYYEFLDNIASKQIKKRKASLDWYGRLYDPNDIDEKQIVAALKRIARSRRLV